MTIENQEQETQEFETDNTEFENEQEAEAETEKEEAEAGSENQEQEQENSEESEEENKSTPHWVKDLRKKNREMAKKLKEYEANTNNAPNAEIELPKKPKIEDFNYDEDAHETALDNWYSQKQKIESVKQTKQQQIEQQKAEFNNKLHAYNENIAKLNIDRPKFNEAENVVKDLFTIEQQNLMLLYADNPTKLIYALGRDEDIAEELAGINDKAKFLVAIAKHEEKIKMKTTKTVPPAERKVNAGANVPAVSADKKLDALLLEAEKSGNYTKYIAYKKTIKGK